VTEPLFALSDLVDLAQVRVRRGDDVPGMSSAAGAVVGGPNTRRPRHNGIDIRVRRGAPVYAPVDVRVVTVLRDRANGTGLILETTEDDARARVRLGMAHLAALDARVVSYAARGITRPLFRAGDMIAFAGSTGRSTGPHIHLTLTDSDGRKRDPAPRIEWDLTP